MFLKLHVLFYRLTNGSFGGRISGAEVLLLTTIGRKTGKKRTWALNYFRDGPNYVVIASNGGQQNNPGWYYNLKGKEITSVQIKNVEQKIIPRIADNEERDRLWTKITKQYTFYADYQKKTDRKIPIIILKPTS